MGTSEMCPANFAESLIAILQSENFKNVELRARALLFCLQFQYLCVRHFTTLEDERLRVFRVIFFSLKKPDITVFKKQNFGLMLQKHMY